MPIPLLDRCQPDSTREFRAAATQRATDAQRLLGAERRTAAIYLWGYVVEMTLKAAYFNVIGFPDNRPITRHDLLLAARSAPALGVAWPGNLHDIRAWAELIVATRAARPGLAYATPGFGNTVVIVARRVNLLWRETLRYHKNVAYRYEVNLVRTATNWLLTNAHQL